MDFPERRTGAHRPWGFLAASGPRIGKGLALKPVHLMDLAPTILHLTGVEIPARYDGRILSELIIPAG
jgi:predicted AlkP superfamily phosphohydrolase/phosphomutase